MMTQQLNVCVVAAPLAAIDRRALSQAWYSALHCASGHGRVVNQRTRRGVVPKMDKREDAQSRKSQQGRGGARRDEVQGGKGAKALARGTGTETERRARRSPLARRIERTFLDPRSTPKRASFSAGGKRVHVIVQAAAGRVSIVALCHPAVREIVARALAQARFALASRGVACS
ncbi:MAG TPA: hypothetical protein VFE36_14660 [Candidatus Baltobacteraceae bacterium]|jgi:hypothetical protein|nr:hypothetical protein [Candidatus Baltobacteraceae bacterium]